MSSIYGSSKKSRFLELHKANVSNNVFDNSFICLNRESFDFYKFRECSADFKFKNKKYNSILGISLNKCDTFDIDYMNPVVYDPWIISAFGNIRNATDLIDDFYSKEEKYIESDIFLLLLDYHTKNNKKEVKIISESLGLIDGSYSAWIYNMDSGNTFIVKNESDIYADIYNNEFSTAPFKGFEPLNDNEIYQLTPEGITSVGVFDFC